MNSKHILAISALLISSQAFAGAMVLTHPVCGPAEVGEGNCSGDGNGGGLMSTFIDSFTHEGNQWELYNDDAGGFAIETSPDGKETFHQLGLKAQLLKKAPPRNLMMRSKLVLGPSVPGMSAEEAKQKAAAEKAAAAMAAKKAAENKAAAEGIQKSGGLGAYSTTVSGPFTMQPGVALQAAQGNGRKKP